MNENWKKSYLIFLAYSYGINMIYCCFSVALLLSTENLMVKKIILTYFIDFFFLIGVHTLMYYLVDKYYQSYQWFSCGIPEKYSYLLTIGKIFQILHILLLILWQNFTIYVIVYHYPNIITMIFLLIFIILQHARTLAIIIFVWLHYCYPKKDTDSSQDALLSDNDYSINVNEY